MKHLRRHWKMTLTVSVVVILSGTALLRNGRDRSARAQVPPPYETLTEIEQDAIMRLLANLSLDRDALIAANLSGEQAVSILGAVRTWHTTNAAALAILKVDIDDAVEAVRTFEQAIAMGPFDAAHASQLALARGDLAAASGAYDSALSPVQTSVNALLSVSQRTTWSAIQSGHGQAMPLRMLDLTDDQRVALSRAQRHYKWRHAAASDAAERASAVSDWEAARDSILTTGQQSVVSAYHSNYDTASVNVTGGFETVFPPAEEG